MCSLHGAYPCMCSLSSLRIVRSQCEFLNMSHKLKCKIAVSCGSHAHVLFSFYHVSFPSPLLLSVCVCVCSGGFSVVSIGLIIPSTADRIVGCPMWCRLKVPVILAAGALRHSHERAAPVSTPARRLKRKRVVKSLKVTPTVPTPPQSIAETAESRSSSSLSSLSQVVAIVSGVEAEKREHQCASSCVLPLQPDAVDYRALLLDLLLYRKETLAPLLNALAEERWQLESRMHELDKKVAELADIRDDIRRALEAHHAQEELRCLHVVEQVQEELARQRDSQSNHEVVKNDSRTSNSKGDHIDADADEEDADADEEFVL